MTTKKYNPIKTLTHQGKEVKAILAQCRTDGDYSKWSKALTSTALMEFSLIFQSLRASFGDALQHGGSGDLNLGAGIYATITADTNSEVLSDHWDINVMPDVEMRELAKRTFMKGFNRNVKLDDTELAKFIEFSINSWVAHKLLHGEDDFFVYTGKSYLLADELDEMNDSVAMLEANVGIEEMIALGRVKEVLSMSVYNLDGCIMKCFTTEKGCSRLYNLMEACKEKDGHMDTAIEVSLESVVRDPAELGDDNWLVLISDNDTAFRQGPLTTWDQAVKAVIEEFGGLHD